MSRVVQCDGDPSVECRKDVVCPNGLPEDKGGQRLHDWARLINRDGYRCDACGVTYLGGPTVECRDPGCPC